MQTRISNKTQITRKEFTSYDIYYNNSAYKNIDRKINIDLKCNNQIINDTDHPLIKNINAY